MAFAMSTRAGRCDLMTVTLFEAMGIHQPGDCTSQVCQVKGCSDGLTSPAIFALDPLANGMPTFVPDPWM